MAGLLTPAIHFSLVMSAGTRVAILNGLRLRSEAVEVSALCSVVCGSWKRSRFRSIEAL